MSLFFRDPFSRDPFSDLDRWALYPVHRHHRHPVRVQRVPASSLFSDELISPQSFDRALSQLQNVMDDVTAAIGEYQSGPGRDLVAGQMKTVRTEDGNLQMAIDVSQYKPEEINVRLCDDNLVVEAKTESSESDSYHKSEFKRWLRLPSDCKHEAIKSTLTPDKKLLIEVPMAKPIADSRSRSIPIDIQKSPDPQQQGGDKKQQQQQAVEGGKK